MILRHFVIAFILAGSVLFLSAMPVYAAVSITQFQKLDFGKWFFGDDSSPQTITVTPGGSYSTSSANLVMFRAPRPGIYTITGLPAFTTFTSVTVTMAAPMQFGGRTMDITNFSTVLPDADGSGNTALRVGAEAVTLGDGSGYPGGTYDGTIDIIIDY
jgi:Domain of unknown function (DUF4402)